MDLLPVLLVGLLGSVHCAGMCGGFVFALAQSSSHRWQFVQKQSMYYLGKTCTYALLGGIAGAFGYALSALFSRFQLLFSLLLGLLLVLVGLELLGLIKRNNTSPLSKVWRSVSQQMTRLLGDRSSTGPFALGLINGVLPCGLVYAAIVLAAESASSLQGALIMTVFGLSTIPALLATAIAGLLLKPAWRQRINLISGGVIVCLGLLTMYRGLPMGQHDHHGATEQQSSEEYPMHTH